MENTNSSEAFGINIGLKPSSALTQKQLKQHPEKDPNIAVMSNTTKSERYGTNPMIETPNAYIKVVYRGRKTKVKPPIPKINPKSPYAQETQPNIPFPIIPAVPVGATKPI
jgi:hypothetical protein